jgi:twitching motility protein PilT
LGERTNEQGQGPDSTARGPESGAARHTPLELDLPQSWHRPATPSAQHTPLAPVPGSPGQAVHTPLEAVRPAPPPPAAQAPRPPAPLPRQEPPLGAVDLGAERSGSPNPVPPPHVPLRAEAEDEDLEVLTDDEEFDASLTAVTPVPASDLEQSYEPSGGPRLDLPGPDLGGAGLKGLSPRHQLEAWLAEMVKARASDLILRAGGRPSCRVDGRITFLPGRVPGAGALQEVLEGIVGTRRMDEWRDRGSADVALQLDGLGRFRLNAYRQMGEPALVLRRVAETPPKLEALCLPTGMLQKLAKRRRGIILVTGVAGSGKSTTLAALIQHMNESSERHVITLEDPVELIFQEDRCVISQREIGTDLQSFDQGLRHCLRQSPDVILIGEMRDAETVQAALDATETGHLVMSTLHTVNAAQTVDRIISFFPPEQHVQIRARLADNLAAVLSQRLLPRRTGKGMVPALELMTSTPRVMELLAEGRTVELSKAIEMGEGGGLISFNQSLRQLVEAGLIELETALGASDKPDELLLALRGFSTSGGRGGNKAQANQAQRPQLKLERTSNDLSMG